MSATEALFLADSYLTHFDAEVLAVDDGRVLLDRTAFYATSGGQQHDTGLLKGSPVVDVRWVGTEIWHTLEASHAVAVGERVSASIDWQRRFENMRTHTAMHIVSALVCDRFNARVTGCHMEPLAARMDFDVDAFPSDFAAVLEEAVAAEVERDRLVTVALTDGPVAGLLRTSTNLLPDRAEKVRVVRIEGLDEQADGGTHVRSTIEVGRVEVVGIESKGRRNKRVRVLLS
jgi:misacylated tRNA(Ala) deacylase